MSGPFGGDEGFANPPQEAPQLEHWAAQIAAEVEDRLRADEDETITGQWTFSEDVDIARLERIRAEDHPTNSYFSLDSDEGVGSNLVLLASINKMAFIMDTNNNSSGGTAFSWRQDSTDVDSASEMMMLDEDGFLWLNEGSNGGGVYTGDGDDSNSIFQSAGFGRFGIIGVNLVYDGSGDPLSNMNYIDDTGNFGQAGIVAFLGSNNPKFEVHKADDVGAGDAGTNAPLSKIFGVDSSGNGTFWNHSGRVTLSLRSDSAGTSLGSTIKFVHNTTTQMEIVYHNSDDELRIRDSQGGGTQFQFRTNGSLYLTQYNSTAGGSNANITSPTGELRRTTSSLKYKRDLRDLHVQEGRDVVRSLRPIRYRSNIPEDDQTVDWLGLIAEEVAEVDPSLVDYDVGGEPSTVYYDRLVVPLVSVSQDHEKRITQLEEKLRGNTSA